MTVSVSYLSKNCTTCLFISKSFKELFFNAFVSKADAKVRLFFEPPKLFEVFLKRQVQNPIFVQYFITTAFLSRKRVQNYCFTAYPPNISNSFFILFCSCLRKSLILKRCRRADFEAFGLGRYSVLPYYLYARTYIQGISKNNLHFIHREDKLQIHNK